MKTQLLTLFIIVYVCNIPYAQTWTNYNTANTSTQLPHCTVNCTTIDPQGNKWFGTLYGLSKFDGTTWTTYNQQNIAGIASDNAGNIWYVFNNDTKITKFDGKIFTTYSDKAGASNVSALTVDQSGNVWFGCDGCILKFDGVTWTKINSSYYFINCIAVDSKGKIWLGGDRGVATYDGTSWFFYSSLGNAFTPPVYALAFDHSGYTLAGTYNGIEMLKGMQYSFIQIPYSLSPSSNAITSIIIDKNNCFLFGTKEGGVKKLCGNVWSSYSTDQGIISNSITSLSFDSGNKLWIGTKEGVSVFDGTSSVNYSNNGLKSNVVNSVIRDSDDKLWFATDRGVSTFDGKIWNSYLKSDGLANNNVLCMTIDQTGTKWFGTGNDGITKFDGIKWQTYTYSDGLAGNSVSSIRADHENNIWIGSTFQGVTRYDGKTFTILDKTNSGIADNRMSDIEIDSYGNKWFATFSGISKFDNSIWQTYKRSWIMANNSYYDLEFDKQGNLWASTNLELFRIVGNNWEEHTYSIPYSPNLKTSCDSDGNLYVASGQNFYKYNMQTWEGLGEGNNPYYGLSPHCIYIDRFGYKWYTYSIDGVTCLDDGGAGPLNVIKIMQRGLVFYDVNADGKKENNEPGLPMQIINTDSNFTTTQNGGDFSIYTTEGSHIIRFIPQPNWKSTTDSMQLITLNNGVIPDTLFFGVRPVENVHDVSISLVGSHATLNSIPQFWINYKNTGTEIESGTIQVNFDPRLTIEYVYPPADIFSGNTLTWSLSNFVPQQTAQIHVKCQRPIFEMFGDTLRNTATFTINNTDIFPADNSENLQQIVSGPVDPNDKLVSPSGTGSDKKVQFGQELTYTIHFQNTGTDTANNVVIRDTLSNLLDLSSFRLIASSHPVTFDLRENNSLTFTFGNIFLPDSNVNEPLSNGFVKYSIKPKSDIEENTVVTNKAYIFFDFNPAIVTNITSNTYVSNLLSRSEVPEIYSRVYPNPFHYSAKISFSNPSHEKLSLSITTLQGQTIKEISDITSEQVVFEYPDIKPGIYFYKLRNSNSRIIITGKLVKW